jgi:hypothetical protein
MNVVVEEEKDGTDLDDKMDENEESIYGCGPRIIIIGLVM